MRRTHIELESFFLLLTILARSRHGAAQRQIRPIRGAIRRGDLVVPDRTPGRRRDHHVMDVHQAEVEKSTETGRRPGPRRRDQGPGAHRGWGQTRFACLEKGSPSGTQGGGRRAGQARAQACRRVFHRLRETVIRPLHFEVDLAPTMVRRLTRKFRVNMNKKHRFKMKKIILRSICL